MQWRLIDRVFQRRARALPVFSLHHHEMTRHSCLGMPIHILVHAYEKTTSNRKHTPKRSRPHYPCMSECSSECVYIYVLRFSVRTALLRELRLVLHVRIFPRPASYIHHTQFSTISLRILRVFFLSLCVVVAVRFVCTLFLVCVCERERDVRTKTARRTQ